MNFKRSKPIYLDYAATTPIDVRVLAEFQAVQRECFGNPHSRHSFGQAAMIKVDRAREHIASLLHADPMGIIFTSGATEANNLCLRGALADIQPGQQHQLLISAIEHPSVFEPSQRLRREGVGVGTLGVSHEGVLRLEELDRNVNEQTRLISVMAVNNEIGSIQPLAEIGAWIQRLNLKRTAAGVAPVLFHVDATQALLTLPVNITKWNADFCSISAHKIYGPKGCGALIARNPQSLKPLMNGGPQERSLRPGTVNVPAIAAFATAMELNEQEQENETPRLRRLRDQTQAMLADAFPELRWLGPMGDDRIANNLNFYFPDLDSATLAVTLDLEGFAVSTGSACASGSEQRSHVLQALNLPHTPRSSVRVTFGRQTQVDDLREFVLALERVVRHQRSLAGAGVGVGSGSAVRS